MGEWILAARKEPGKISISLPGQSPVGKIVFEPSVDSVEIRRFPESVKKMRRENAFHNIRMVECDTAGRVMDTAYPVGLMKMESYWEIASYGKRDKKYYAITRLECDSLVIGDSEIYRRSGNAGPARTGCEADAFPVLPAAGIKPLAQGLYLDSRGGLLLKVRNREARPPSRIGGTWPDSIFLDHVLDMKDSTRRALAKVIDRPTFARADPQGSYFMDAARFYVHSMQSDSNRFFALPRGKVKLLGSAREYFLYGGGVFSHGVRMKGVAVETVEILRYNRSDRRGFQEFLTDGKKIYSGPYPLDEKRLESMVWLYGKDKRKIRERFFSQSGGHPGSRHRASPSR